MREASHKPLPQGAASGQPEHEIEQAILAAIKSLRYGSVEIIVQDSKVVQIERREKIRFDKDGTKKAR